MVEDPISSESLSSDSQDFLRSAIPDQPDNSRMSATAALEAKLYKEKTDVFRCAVYQEEISENVNGSVFPNGYFPETEKNIPTSEFINHPFPFLWIYAFEMVQISSVQFFGTYWLPNLSSEFFSG